MNEMRKSSVVAVVLSLIFLLSACESTGRNIDNIGVTFSSSTKFTNEEIQQAVDAVKEKFKEFEHCELHSLSYEEEKSDAQIEIYLQSGKGSDNGTSAENTIVLFSNFDTDSQADGRFMPDTNYDWMFILIREEKDGNWIVDDWGY